MNKIYKNILNKKFLFFIILAILVFYRSPYILLEGRFLAEEGEYWYRNIFLNGQLKTLILIIDMSGYINMWMNIAAFFSGLVPMQYAPLVTVYFSFVLLMYIFFYIINSKSDLFPTNNSKYIGCMIVLFSPVMTAEIWLNSLNAMSYLGILTFLILFENNQLSSFKRFNFFVLLVSGLSAFYASALAPIYFIKYFHTKNKTDLLNFFILFLTSTIQISITFYSMIANEIATNRFYIGYEKIVNYLYNIILKSLFGREFLQKIMTLINLDLLIFFSFIFFIVAIIFFLRILITKKDYVLRLIFAAFVIESFLVLFASAYADFVGGRYQVVSGVIFSFMFLRLFYLQKEKFKKFLCGFIVLFFLIVGFIEFKQAALYPNLLSCIDCPKWENEVSKWKINNKYRLKVWPYPNQTMILY